MERRTRANAGEILVVDDHASNREEGATSAAAEFHSGEHEFGQTSLELRSENPAHLFMNAKEVVRAKSANAFNARIS